MKVVVTGAAGFIGSHLTDRLLAEGHRVTGLDSFDDFYDPAVKERNLAGALEHDAFTLVRGDLREAGDLAALPDDAEMVIHLAARAGVRPSIRNPRLYASVNLDGTVALLEWMRARGVDNLLFASSSSVYGNSEKVPFSEDDPVEFPISPYAATKRSGELVCHTYHHLFDLSVVALRFFTAYGPRQRPDLAIHKFARLIRAGEPIPMYGDGSSERDYTYVDDIVQGVLGAMEFVGEGPPAFEIVNLGESRTVSLSEMIEVIADEMGVTPDIDQLPMQPGDVDRTYADIRKARRLLGYDPQTGFREGVRAFLGWLEAEKGGKEVAG